MSFRETVTRDEAVLFMHQVASVSGPEGLPTRLATDEPVGSYVVTIRASLLRVEAAIEEARRSFRMMESPPPQAWLDEFNLDTLGWVQRQVDHGTLVLYSASDRCALLANAVLRLGLEDRMCTFRIVARAASAYPEVVSELQGVFTATASVTAPRHHYVHKGIKRNVHLLSNVSRAALITKKVGVPTEGVLFNVEGATAAAVDLLQSEVQVVDAAIHAFLPTLLPGYLENLSALGGIPPLDPTTVTRAREALDYFRGGDRPAWMDAK